MIVTFDIDEEDLTLYDVKMNKIVEFGKFSIFVSASSMEKNHQKVQLTVR